MSKQLSNDDGTKDVVVWVRLPHEMDLKDLKKLGLPKVACYGGDTCIAAASFDPEAAIVVQGNLKNLLERTGFNPQLACFGGNSCIV